MRRNSDKWGGNPNVLVLLVYQDSYQDRVRAHLGTMPTPWSIIKHKQRRTRGRSDWHRQGELKSRGVGVSGIRGGGACIEREESLPDVKLESER